jgi:hypothetical protein
MLIGVYVGGWLVLRWISSYWEDRDDLTFTERLQDEMEVLAWPVFAIRCLVSGCCSECRNGD